MKHNLLVCEDIRSIICALDKVSGDEEVKRGAVGMAARLGLLGTM